MTPAERAARQIETVLRDGDFQGLRDLLTPGFTDHSAPPGTPPGPDGYVEFMRYLTESLGITYHLDDVVSAGDQVALRATAHGVHNVGAFGLPATGRPFAMPTMHWDRADATSAWSPRLASAIQRLRIAAIAAGPASWPRWSRV